MAAAVLAAAIASVAWRFLTFSGFNNDHYVHVARAYQILLGEWPVRDFVDPGMPLMYLVSAAARTALGPTLRSEFLVVAAAFAVGTACTAAAAAWLSRSMLTALTVTLLTIVINTRSFGYPKILLYAVAAVLIVRTVQAPNGWRLVALAGVTAAAFLFRHDHGLFIGVSAFVAVVAASVSEGARLAIRRGATLIAWTLVLLAPWALYVQMHGGLVAYFAAGLTFWRSEASAMTLQTLPVIQWAAVGGKSNAIAWLFFLFHLLPVLALALVVPRWLKQREAWPGESAAVIAVAVMALLVNAFFMRESLEARIPDAVVPAALLGAWMIGLAFARPHQGLRYAALACAAVVIGVTTGAVVRAADVGEQAERAQLTDSVAAMRRRTQDLWQQMGRQVPDRDHAPSRYSAALLPFIEYVDRCTTRDDRLMVTGLFPEVYVIADRGFAGGHIAFLSAFYTDEAEQERTISRLRRQSVPFVLLIEDVRQAMPRLMAYVDAQYQSLTHVEVPGAPGVQVLVERSRSQSSIDHSTGWPCVRER